MTTTVLITGATGFIGRFLVDYLLAQDIKVRVLVRQSNPALLTKGVEEVVGDLTLPRSLIGAAHDIDTVFHLAGYAHAQHGNEVLHQQINLQGTQNILQECCRAKVKKFIFFSSIKAVGNSSDALTEHCDLLPTTPYGQAKRAAEACVLAEKNNMQVCILRLALVYGPGLKGNLFHMLRAIDKKIFPPLPKVHNRRSLVSVYDVCRAAYCVMQNPKASGKIYFISEAKPYSTYDIYCEMHHALKKRIPKIFIPYRIFKCMAYLGDCGERFLRKRLPFNSEAFEKLWGHAQCSSLRIQEELNFETTDTLSACLPDIIQTYEHSKT